MLQENLSVYCRGFIFVQRKFKEPLGGTTIIVDASIDVEDA